MDRIRSLLIWLPGILLAGLIFHGDTASAQEEVASAIRKHLAAGQPPSGVAKTVAKQSGWDRRRVYKIITEESHE